MNILITGALGYIGSHACVEFSVLGHKVIGLDNFTNSKFGVIDHIRSLCHMKDFYSGDVRNRQLLDEIFSEHAIDAVIHFAGLKAVGESVQKPIDYYDNNVYGTLTLVDAMRKVNVKTLIFSSSATVYGDQPQIPYQESFLTGIPASPYGRSKLMVEQILQDLQRAEPEWSIVLLRYFNPVGAHPSGEMGEDPQGIPNNLMPYIAQVAVGKREELNVFGGDYPTKDGTPMRDYIDVNDLVEGHVAAFHKLCGVPGVHVYNLGSGKALSVLELINSFETASGSTIKYKIVGRRDGDLSAYWASSEKAEKELGWKARTDIEETCSNIWKWINAYPNGYSDRVILPREFSPSENKSFIKRLGKI